MMSAPNLFLTRTDSILRARRAFWLGVVLGVFAGMAISAAILFSAAFFVAWGGM